VTDIDKERMVIHIHQGQDDREVDLSEKLLRDPARVLALDATENVLVPRHREQLARGWYCIYQDGCCAITYVVA
jgi:hypothetical protein